MRIRIKTKIINAVVNNKIDLLMLILILAGLFGGMPGREVLGAKAAKSGNYFPWGVYSMLANCNEEYQGIKPPEDAIHTMIEDDFASASGDWKEVYLEGTSGGSYSLSNGVLKIEMDGEGRYGVYHSKPISGHFLVEADFLKDENIALALIQDKGGKRDTEN